MAGVGQTAAHHFPDYAVLILTYTGSSLEGAMRSPDWRPDCDHQRMLANSGLLLVVGPSGCGKSSLVRAGLLPVMAFEPGWLTLPPVVPGADPVAALAGELAREAKGLTAGLDCELGTRPAGAR